MFYIVRHIIYNIVYIILLSYIIYKKIMDDMYITLIISSLTLFSNLLLHLKLRHVNSFCCSSDCIPSRNNTPSISPITSKSNLLQNA